MGIEQAETQDDRQICNPMPLGKQKQFQDEMEHHLIVKFQRGIW